MLFVTHSLTETDRCPSVPVQPSFSDRIGFLEQGPGGLPAETTTFELLKDSNTVALSRQERCNSLAGV
ncbi:hypothetical protein JCM18750_36590 [Halostagnicola bangensis]